MEQLQNTKIFSVESQVQKCSRIDSFNFVVYLFFFYLKMADYLLTWKMEQNKQNHFQITSKANRSDFQKQTFFFKLLKEFLPVNLQTVGNFHNRPSAKPQTNGNLYFLHHSTPIENNTIFNIATFSPNNECTNTQMSILQSDFLTCVGTAKLLKDLPV